MARPRKPTAAKRVPKKTKGSGGNKAVQFDSLLRRNAPRPTALPTQPIAEPV